MTNYAAGHDAEKRVANHLQKQKYKILDINWRTRRCEIDIVASKNNVIWFFEVKYRKTVLQGSGFDYITQTKLRQMTYAAEVWVQEHGYEGDYRLAVASVSPDCIELLTEL